MFTSQPASCPQRAAHRRLCWPCRCFFQTDFKEKLESRSLVRKKRKIRHSVRTCKDFNFYKCLEKPGAQLPPRPGRTLAERDKSPRHHESALGGKPEASYQARQMVSSEHSPHHETCTCSSQLELREGRTPRDT